MFLFNTSLRITKCVNGQCIRANKWVRLNNYRGVSSGHFSDVKLAKIKEQYYSISLIST